MASRSPREDDLDALRQRAIDGDAEALDGLIRSVADDVYRLALRMVWDRNEAEDATQEILTKVATKLSTFRGESSLRTWVYRVSVNHLLKRRRTQFEALTFSELAADLVDGLADPLERFQPELESLAHEVMVSCTRAMLQCLDRDQRTAYLLGDVLELSGVECASILGIEAAAFRKRLSRARQKVRVFMSGNCGLVDDRAACRCSRRVNRAVELGRVSPTGSTLRIDAAVEEIDHMQRINALMRSTAVEAAPPDVIVTLRAALDTSLVLMDDR